MARGQFSPIMFMVRLLPALIGAAVELGHAMKKDSEGGKKVTKEEGEEIGKNLLDGLVEPVGKEIYRQLR